MQLHTQYEAVPGSKWTDEEVDMLRKAVQQFGNDLEKISEVIKTRTMSQVKHAIKRKVYSEAGLPLTNMKNPKQQSRKRSAPTTPNKTVAGAKENSVTHQSAVPIKMPKLSPKAVYKNDASVTMTDMPEMEVPGSAIITEQVNTDSIVDVENLDDTASLKKIDQYMSSQPSLDSRTPGGVSESAVSNPPPLPPLDLVSEQT